jgi:hypothetical protein
MAEPRFPEMIGEGFLLDEIARETVMQKIEKYESMCESVEEKITKVKQLIENDDIGFLGEFIHIHRVQLLKMYESELDAWKILTEKWKNHVAIK